MNETSILSSNIRFFAMWSLICFLYFKGVNEVNTRKWWCIMLTNPRMIEFVNYWIDSLKLHS